MTGQASQNMERVRDLAGKGMTQEEIAAALGLCQPYVSTLAKRGGVTTAKKKPPLIDRIRSLAAQGRTRQQIADEVGVFYNYVSVLGKKHGIAFSRQPYSGAKRKPDAREFQMAALYTAGKTLNEIGQEFGITRERVRQLLVKFFSISGQDGGQHKRAIDNRFKFEAKRNQRSIARWGCSWDDYAKLRALKKPTRAFASQRKNADSRGIKWELTLWQWWSIWQQSGHWTDRGRGNGYCMCRKGDQGPYSVDNVYIAARPRFETPGRACANIYARASRPMTPATAKRSVRAFLTRHRLIKKIVERASQVVRAFKRQTNASADSGLGLAISIRNDGCERQGNNIAKNTSFDLQVSTNRLNVCSIGNLQNEISELNRFSGRSFTHRSILLFIDESGQAYDLAGRKWSPS